MLGCCYAADRVFWVVARELHAIAAVFWAIAMQFLFIIIFFFFLSTC